MNNVKERKAILAEFVDAELGKLVDEDPMKPDLRELHLVLDERKLKSAKEISNQLRRLGGPKRMSMAENAIVASYYRDLRSYAASNFMYRLFNFAFQQEQLHRKNMLLSSRGVSNKVMGAIYFVWSLVNSYGTSLPRWLLVGAVVPLFFSVPLYCIEWSTDAGASPMASLLLSIETFCQISYQPPSELPLKAIHLVERLTGMLYFAFGFGMLLPRLSLELSRTITTHNAKSQ